jgi:hypothetical protein
MACAHPKLRRTRKDVDLGQNERCIQETCDKCGAERHYLRNDITGTVSSWTEWTGPRRPAERSKGGE